MKNFTKQNFKTNPLWIRLLIMAFMLFTGACAAFADGSAGGPKGVYLNVDGTNTWYNVYSTSWDYNPSCSGWNTFKSAASISGKDLGTVTTLQLKGYAVIGWTNNSDWVSGELRYQINSGSYTYFKVGNWDSGSSAADVQCTSGNDRVVGLNNQSVNLLTGLTPGNHTIKFMPSGRMRYNGGNFNPVSHPELSAKFTVPGYSTTSGSHSFGEVDLGSQETQTFDLTHYGSDNTATVSTTGTNKSEFTATIAKNGNNKQTLTVIFKPATLGQNKTATVTVTDAYSKTYTLKVTGTGKQSCQAPTSVSITRSDAPSTANICQGSTIDLTANVDGGSGDITYVWTKTSGSNDWTIDNASVQKCTVKAGTGSAQFKINATQCEKTVEATIELTADAKSALTLKANPTICQASSIKLSDYVQSSTGTVKWYSNSGMTTEITDPSVARTPQSNPTYYYARATSGVCSSVDKTLTVTLSPQPAIALKAAPTICNGTTIAFPDYVDNNNTIGTVSWYLDEDRTQSAGVTAKPSQTTTYYAKAVSGACDPVTAQLKVTVNDKPGKPTLGASNTALVAGDNAILTVSNTETGATYTLYKDGVSTGKTGTSFTVNEAGSYTVKGKNDCGESDASTAVVITVCNPIKSAKLYFADSNYNKLDACPTYCAGSTAYFVLEYTGERDGDKTWTRSDNFATNLKGTEEHYYFTINTSGSISVTIPTCDGTSVTTNTLTYPTANITTAPATPTIAFSVNPVGQSKETILSIASYSADNNYIVYRSADNAVGNDTEVGTYTAPMSIRHNDTGSYYYYAKATNKSCANLTATSEIVKLTVQEADAIIAALGDLKIDPQDPVDFVAMYVKNDGLADFSAQGATSVTGYTWQFSSDGVNNWSNCASTNVVDGVNYELGMENGSANCNNFRPNKAGTYRCVVKYNTGDTQNSNYLTVTADGSTAKTFKGVTMTLPVVSVNTGSSSFPINNFGGTPSKNADKMKEKISVDVKIFENINGTTQVVYDRKARMNYRGSSSLNFLKKSYAFCPGDEICGDKKGIDYVKTKKLNMLGIGSAKDKDWVLYAAAADPSLMRNRLVFDTFRDMTGGWSVSSRYVELVVNGEYKGVYVMMDKITANKDRVNVEWKLDANGNTTQEAFIVKFDKTDREDRYEITSGDQKTFKSKYSGHDGFDTYDTNIDQRFEVEYPEKEDIEDGKGKWSDVFNAIENKINKFEEELAKGNFSEVQKLIDYTSWADWFIITEFAKNIDGYRASNIFVYDGSKANAKIEARPLWDQELSFNNQCPSYYADYGSNSTSGLLIDKSNSAVYNNDASAPFWFTGKYKGDRGKYNGSDQTFKGLLDDPCFVAEVKARWAQHVSGALSQATMTAKVTKYKSDLGDIATSGTPMNRELTFWKNKSRATIDCGTGSGCYDGTTGYSAYNTQVSITNSATALTNWLTGNRRTNLGNIINGWESAELNITLTITPGTGITTPWEAVMVQVNNPSGYDYDLEYTTNTLDKVSGVIINENNDKYTYRIPRPEDWKPGDEDKDGERTDIQYGIKATLKVGDGMAQCGNSSQAPSATTTITLQDEANENCPK